RFRNCSISWAVTPGKLGYHQAKGTVLSPVTSSTRRAGCIERCSSGSMGAFRSNPVFNGVIPDFYPIEIEVEIGRPRNASQRRKILCAVLEPRQLKVVSTARLEQGGEKSGANPSSGTDGPNAQLSKFGCKTREVPLTLADAGSPVSDDASGRTVMGPGIRRKSGT